MSKIEALLICDEVNEYSYFKTLFSRESLKYDKIHIVMIGAQRLIQLNLTSSGQYNFSVNIPLPIGIKSVDMLNLTGLNNYANRIIDFLFIDEILSSVDGYNIYFYNYHHYYLARHFKTRLSSKIIVYVDDPKDKPEYQLQLYSIADLILCYAQEDELFILKQSVDYADKVKTISPLIYNSDEETTDLILSRRNYGFHSDDKVILMNTILSDNRILMSVIEIFDHLVNDGMRIRLIIAGKFDLKILKNYDINFLSRIIFTGEISEPDFLKLGRVAEVVLLVPSSELKSGLYPSVLMRGLKLISTDIGCPLFLRTTELIRLISVSNESSKLVFDYEVFKDMLISILDEKEHTSDRLKDDYYQTEFCHSSHLEELIFKLNEELTS